MRTNQISAFNVVTCVNSKDIDTTSFKHTKAGLRDAKILMYDLIKSDDESLLDEEIEEYVSKCEYSVDGMVIMISTSTPVIH